MSDQVSNKSSVSSPRSLVGQDLDDAPALITIKERLPTFTEAATIHLPRTMLPRTTEVLLRMHPDINEAIHTITYGLITTIHRRTLATSQELDASCTREQQLHHQLIACSLKVTHLQGQLGTVNI